MDREDLEYLQGVQDYAYRLYAMNKMPEDDYRLLDNTIDTILSNNGVNVNNENDIQP